MASYETEHNVSHPPPSTIPNPRRRPDMSTFFSNLEQVDTSSTQNEHSVPTPANVSAVFRLGIEGLQETISETNPEGEVPAQMLEMLRAQMEMPPKEVRGVSEQWLTDLERVPRKMLKKGEECPICGVAFLEDEYPLVVRLPCNTKHLFDLECIQPWLKLNPTCPLDRKDFLEKKEVPPPVKDDDEEEYDDMYG